MSLDWSLTLAGEQVFETSQVFVGFQVSFRFQVSSGLQVSLSFQAFFEFHVSFRFQVVLGRAGGSWEFYFVCSTSCGAYKPLGWLISSCSVIVRFCFPHQEASRKPLHPLERPDDLSFHELLHEAEECIYDNPTKSSDTVRHILRLARQEHERLVNQ